MTCLVVAALLMQSSAPAASAVDLVMMVDVSRSVAYGVIRPDRTLLSDVGSAVAASLGPGDTIRIGTFGDAIVLDETPLRDAAAVRAAATALGEHLGGASPIWDALVTAASTLSNAGRRRAIVVVTDGRSSGNRLGFAEAVERLQAARIPVFVVAIDKSDRAIPDPGARLIKLAEATGGTCLFVERPVLGGAIRRAVQTLRARP
jgi:Mg-chelatase subunit ChlD